MLAVSLTHETVFDGMCSLEIKLKKVFFHYFAYMPTAALIINKLHHVGNM